MDNLEVKNGEQAQPEMQKVEVIRNAVQIFSSLKEELYATFTERVDIHLKSENFKEQTEGSSYQYEDTDKVNIIDLKVDSNGDIEVHLVILREKEKGEVKEFKFKEPMVFHL